jgi:hypothetical protein
LVKLGTAAAAATTTTSTGQSGISSDQPISYRK